MIYTMDWFFSSTFTEIIKTLLSIDSIIYWLIAQFFRFIIDISSADFIMTDLLNTIIDRAYVVAGVFALFIMSYALIKGLFDPDGVFKGKNSLGQIIKNLLIAIALVALMPTIFTYLFRFQAIIINNNVIGNIVLGTDSQAMRFKVDGQYEEVSVENVGYENYIKVASNNVAFSALNAFVYADDNDKPIDLSEKPTVGMFLTPRAGVLGLASGAGKLLTSIVQDNSESNETTFNQLRNNIVITGNFLEINTIAYHVATGGDYANESGAHVTYLFIVSTICGIAMLFLTFAFCINIVVRMFNLFLLELISPIASFSLVIPNSKIFDNWFKAAMKEYLDLFVRLFTFNLAILFFSNINQIIVQVIEGHGNVGLISIMNILFVIGLLIFINEAPKLVKDILGMKDDKKGIKDRLFSGGVSKTLGGALGLLGGGAVAGMSIASSVMDKKATSNWGKAWNAIQGGAKGIEAGKNASKAKSFSAFTDSIDKGVKSANASRLSSDQRAARYKSQYGGGFTGLVKGLGNDAFQYATNTGATLEYERYNEQEKKLKDVKDRLNSINDIADKESYISSLKEKRDSFEARLNAIDKEKFVSDQRKKCTENISEFRNRLSDKYKELELAKNAGASSAQLSSINSDITSLNNKLQKEQNLFDCFKDSNYQDLAFSNYLIDQQNQLQEKDMLYKTARSDFINSQAKSAGTAINLEFERIQKDLRQELDAGNVFMNGIELDANPIALDQVDKYFDDIKDKLFGKSSIYNSKEKTYSIDYSTGDVDTSKLADLRAKYGDNAPVTVLGERMAKHFNRKTGKYEMEDAGIGELAKKIAESVNPNYSSLTGKDKDDYIELIRDSYNKSGEIDALVKNIRDAFKAKVANDNTAVSNAQANITNLLNSSGLASKGISADELTKAIMKINSGISRGTTPGTIDKVHETGEYQAAYRKAYEAKKENK